MNYRSHLGGESDERFDLGNCPDESVSTVVREGATLAVGRDVAVAPAVAAEYLRDTRRWPDWGPAIEAVESDDRYVTRGTRGQVRVAGAWLPFRVTACNDRRWDWRVSGIPATGHRVDSYAGESDRSRVVVEVPLVAAWYVPVCRRALDRFAALVEERSGEKSTERAIEVDTVDDD
ncbi:SRPBCC family protein [Halorubrum halophilum]|uniref:SRPBCC family protein n=1 Tax=Halorubrum halophilum TaxID=413816 RepID=UPI0013782CC8|nr:SRPBCC family protein [Halorubrum halophilum]